MASGNSKALRKLVVVTTFLFRRGFNASKCKAEAKMATARIKLLRNKRQTQILQMKRDIAQLLESGQEDIARIRVEHVIREQNIHAANEIIELFCDLIVARLPIITKEKQCPADLKEGISSVIFAAPRCSELPELLRIRDIFEKKYGKDFSLGASELRPDSSVNRLLIEKLSVKKPSGEEKIKAMKAIAKEFQVNWDPAETEAELLKPQEKRLSGPSSFLRASSMPLKINPYLQQEDNSTAMQFRDSRKEENNSSDMQFTDTASAARAAAEFAAKAAQAASSAARLSKQAKSNSNSNSNSNRSREPSFKSTMNRFSINGSNGSMNHSEEETECDEIDSKRGFVKYDDSEDEDIGGREWPVKKGIFGEEKEYSGSTGSRVHPKMPDYEELTARFEKLRSSGSKSNN